MTLFFCWLFNSPAHSQRARFYRVGRKYKKAAPTFPLTLRQGVCSVAPVARQPLSRPSRERCGVRAHPGHAHEVQQELKRTSGAKTSVCSNCLHQPQFPFPASQVFPKSPTVHTVTGSHRNALKSSFCVTVQPVAWQAPLRGPAALGHVTSYSERSPRHLRSEQKAVESPFPAGTGSLRNSTSASVRAHPCDALTGSAGDTSGSTSARAQVTRELWLGCPPAQGPRPVSAGSGSAGRSVPSCHAVPPGSAGSAGGPGARVGAGPAPRPLGRPVPGPTDTHVETGHGQTRETSLQIVGKELVRGLVWLLPPPDGGHTALTGRLNPRGRPFLIPCLGRGTATM